MVRVIFPDFGGRNANLGAYDFAVAPERNCFRDLLASLFWPDGPGSSDGLDRHHHFEAAGSPTTA